MSRTGLVDAAAFRHHRTRHPSRINYASPVYLRMGTAGAGAYSNSIVVDSPGGSGKQRLLIQASHAYEDSKTNVLHWWLE